MLPRMSQTHKDLGIRVKNPVLKFRLSVGLTIDCPGNDLGICRYMVRVRGITMKDGFTTLHKVAQCCAGLRLEAKK